MTYKGALAYLAELTNYERAHRPREMRAVRLDRMQRLCELLGDPQRGFRSILVAGTNAKGSICAMTYEILRAANLRAGLYTSPHLEDVRERIRVNVDSRPSTVDSQETHDHIGQREFASLVKRLQPVIDSLKQDKMYGAPTYFEALTALAFLYFYQRGVDVAVLEVGLGGRLDATNVVEPAVSILAPIGLDHTDVLGSDVLAIAKEKAGIVKSGVVVTASQKPDVLGYLRRTAAERGCRLVEYGRDISARIISHDPRGLTLAVQGVRGSYEELRLPLLGRHQAENAAVAVAAMELLSDTGVPHSAVRSGLARAQWPGRLEVMPGKPLVVFDGAHNAEAAQALRAALEELWPDRPKHLVIGMSRDKSLKDVAAILGPIAASVTCSTSHHPRACDPHELARLFAPHHPKAGVVNDPVDALMYLLNVAEPDSVIVVTGSLFLVGTVRASLRRAQAQIRSAHSRRPKQMEVH